MKDNSPSPFPGPYEIDSYVSWFNETHTFARAVIVMGKNGKRTIDVQMGRRA